MKSNQLYVSGGHSHLKPLYLPPLFSSQCNSIDWKFFSSINVEKLANSFDYDILQKILPFIAFCNVTTELNVDIDSNFLKLYRLAQILIEYLINSQTKLFDKVSLLHTKIEQQRSKVRSQLRKTEIQRQVIDKLRRELRLFRCNFVSNDVENTLPVPNYPRKFNCEHCYKQFFSLEYLQSHTERRHTQIPYNNSSTLYPFQVVENIHVEKFSTVDNNIPHTTSEAFKLSPLVDTGRNEPIASKPQDINEDLIKRVLEHSSIMEKHLQQLESGIREKQLNDLESVMREDIQHIAKECEIFKQTVVGELKQQETNKTDFENCLKTCRDFIDDFKVHATSSNLGEIEDDNKDRLMLNEVKVDKMAFNSSQKCLSSIDSKVEDFIIVKLSNQLDVLQQQLRSEQSEWLKHKSNEAFFVMNAEISSTNEKFESFKSDMLDICSKFWDKADSLACNPDISDPSRELDIQNSDCHDFINEVSNVPRLDYLNVDSFTPLSKVVQLSKFPHDNIHQEIHIGNPQFTKSMISLQNLIFLNNYHENLLLPYPKKFLFLNYGSSIHPSFLDQIRRSLYSSLEDQLFCSGVINDSDISNNLFRSLNCNLQSTRDKYPDKYPNYILARRTTLSDMYSRLTESSDVDKSKFSSHPEGITKLQKRRNHNCDLFITKHDLPCCYEPESLFESSSKGQLGSVLLPKGPGEADHLCGTSWDSENSNLDQDCNRILSEFTNNEFILQATAKSAFSCDRNSVNMHMNIPYQIQEETIPSDFSLSDVTDYGDLTS